MLLIGCWLLPVGSGVEYIGRLVVVYSELAGLLTSKCTLSDKRGEGGTGVGPC